MRAGYSGSQRFGMIPWSGDVNRTWGGLQSQPEIALQMGMQGLGYMHSDLGGFAGDNRDAELYTRWLQYGVFQPIYRPHAQEDVPAEPVFWDDKTKALAKESIVLRYKLLPYNYNLSFQNHTEGTPLMRPLFFEDDSEKLKTDASEYFWGNDLLIAPILNAGVFEKDIYFPKNSNWFDFYTDEEFEGGQTLTVTVAEDKIPTYVRGGAFIPMGKPMQSTKEYDGNTFELHYYYDASVENSEGQLYNDDGLTAQAFEKGNYELMKFESEVSEKKIEIELKIEIGEVYQVQKKTIMLLLHNINSKPKTVKHIHKKIEFNYNKKQRTVSIPLDWNTSEALKLNINLN